MDALPFDQARDIVFKRVREHLGPPAVETVPLAEAQGRVLARAVAADRDYPPFNRSARDGFAVRAVDVAEVPARLKLIGETRAGEPSRFSLQPGEAVEIMTGAPGPAGSDAVVMVEYSRREGDDVILDQSIAAGRNLILSGSEAACGETVLAPGVTLDYPEIAAAAMVGAADVEVFRRPTVAVVSTGDEVVELDRTPEPFQIRNSNAWSLAAQIRRRGGEPRVLPIAPDRFEETRERIAEGLEADMLLLSGGVSMGKYDLVERALADLGAEFFFTRVRIQPGQPLVFGQAAKKPIFGLPGNPISTMVTFEVFARAALDLLAGRPDSPLPFGEARLGEDFRHKPVLTRFLPARIEGDYGEARLYPVKWQGSGDLVSLARASCFLVAAEGRESWSSGEPMAVLPR